jgi:predicted butyrate kinase (DUF1464 family)
MTISITYEKNNTHEIRPGDPDFIIQNKFTISPRARIEISPNCPNHVATILAIALKSGYIIPVATITDREKTFMGLTK